MVVSILMELLIKYVFFPFLGRSTFYYRGCGWKPKEMSWSLSTMKWISATSGLFDSIFGEDFMLYEYPGDGKACKISQESMPVIGYCHQTWEREFPSLMSGEVAEEPSINLAEPVMSSTLND